MEICYTKDEYQYRICYISGYGKRQLEHSWMKEDLREIIKTGCNHKANKIIAGAACKYLYIYEVQKFQLKSAYQFLCKKSIRMIYDVHLHSKRLKNKLMIL